MADKAINALPVRTAPTAGDKMLMIGAAEEYQIDYDQLATAILNKLTSKTFALDQGTKSLVAALNELNSNCFSSDYISRKISYENTSPNEYVKVTEIELEAGIYIVACYAIYDHGKPIGLEIRSKDGTIISKYESTTGYGNPFLLYFIETGVNTFHSVYCKRTDSDGSAASIRYLVAKVKY